MTQFVVLESTIGSGYDDRPTAYPFPARYRAQFEAIARGEPVCAIIYEPRGDRSEGRMAYVGYATISTPPVPTGRSTRSGQAEWIVQFDEPATEFSNSVPREYAGEPLEELLRAQPRGLLRNQATRGRAVRTVDQQDALRILALAQGDDAVRDLVYPFVSDVDRPLDQIRERAEHVISVIRRDTKFRDDVLMAYEQRCSVSRFTIGPAGPARLNGLIEAAHVRPVGSDGPDTVSNGIALTPTLHRLFDAGFFTLRYTEGRILVRVSPRLAPSMISSPDGSFRMPLRDDVPLWLPTDSSRWPSADQLRFHGRTIFQSS
jgi:putative restriction endonuclease